MHIKHILIFYIGILTCLLLSNCQDETPSVKDTKSLGVNVRKTLNVESRGLNEARQFYINNSTFALKDRGAGKSDSYFKYFPFLRKEPSWIFYICNQKDSMQVVEVDLTDCISQDYILKENWEAYKKYKQHKYLRSYTRYIYIHYLSSGRERAFYMTIVPTIDCVRNYSTRIPRNSYLHRNKYLSGYILYHSLDGNFINGWEYKDGKITGKVVPPEFSINISEKKPLLLGKLNSSYTVELKVESQSRIAARSSEFGEYDSNDDTYDGGWFDDLVVTPNPGNGSNNDDDWNDGSDWDEDGIWDDWQAPETDGDSDDDDSPVVVPDDDGGGGSGGVSGGVDEVPPNISSCKTLEQVQQHIPERLKKVGIDIGNVQILETKECKSYAKAMNGVIYICSQFYSLDIKDQTSIVYHEYYHINNDELPNTDWDVQIVHFDDYYFYDDPPADIMQQMRMNYNDEYEASSQKTYMTLDEYIMSLEFCTMSILPPIFYQNEINAYQNEILTIPNVTESYGFDRKLMYWIYQQKYKIAVEYFNK